MRVVTLWFAAIVALPVFFAASPVGAEDATQTLPESGIVKVRSAYPLAETVERLKRDIADKGIMFFSEINESQLAANAGIEARPTILLVFGNPPLGTQFITSNQLAGLDWPVRLLVFEDANREVWAAYTDFAYIARRHHITDRGDAFAKASMVIASIASSVAVK